MQTIRNLPAGNSISPSLARHGFVLTAIALACFASSRPTLAGQKGREGDLGNGNTFEGAGALFSLTTGFSNTAMGFNTLYSTTDGFANTATGADVLENSDGHGNTGNGFLALQSNTTGSFNTATGAVTLNSNTTGILNTAVGYFTLVSNTTGVENTATGASALRLNTVGNYNTADGREALRENTIGNFNIGLGYFGGYNLTTSGDNNIDIGNQGVDGESNTIRIGEPVPVTNADGIVMPAHTATFIAGIRGTTTGNGDAISVVIDSAGQLGTMSSSRRFKNEIKPMDQTSESILGLKPVTFHYKNDSKGTPQFGLIAEEVAKTNPDLVVRDTHGEVYTVRYEAVNAMLLNEFIKQHRKVEQQEATLARQQKQIEALTTGLQKVSDEVELGRPALQLVGNN
jgi:hypothetical protein